MAEKTNNFIINWSPKSLDSFESITLQILERWNFETALLFDKKVESMIRQLESNPKIFQVSKKSNLRRCVIHKNISLIYRVQKKTVELIVFVDNRDGHGF